MNHNLPFSLIKLENNFKRYYIIRYIFLFQDISGSEVKSLGEKLRGLWKKGGEHTAKMGFQKNP